MIRSLGIQAASRPGFSPRKFIKHTICFLYWLTPWLCDIHVVMARITWSMFFIYLPLFTLSKFPNRWMVGNPRHQPRKRPPFPNQHGKLIVGDFSNKVDPSTTQRLGFDTLKLLTFFFSETLLFCEAINPMDPSSFSECT